MDNDFKTEFVAYRTMGAALTEPYIRIYDECEFLPLDKLEEIVNGFKKDNQMDFVSFPDIELFHNVVKRKTKLDEIYPHIFAKPITYRAKVKLHGTNAGVRIKNYRVAAQSRSQIITPENDNCGFAKWVESQNKYFQEVGNMDCGILGGNPFDMTVFGEWCGAGIQKGTALNQIKTKHFVVFAILEDIRKLFIVDPAEISKIMGELPENIKILPWHGQPVTVDFNSPTSVQTGVDYFNKETLEVEKCDPWVKEVFGIEGIGEGLVYYPITEDGYIENRAFDNYVFKAKGEKHRVAKAEKPVQADLTLIANIDEFVDKFITEARLEQGAATLNNEFCVQNTGKFLKWIGEDVFKESKDELLVSSLTWDQVKGKVQVAARTWWIERCKSLV